MKAAICTKYGSPEVLQIKDVDKPVPKDNELLIRVHGVSVSQVDCASRKGEPFIVRLFSGLFKPRFSIQGDVISGEIESVGKDVKRLKKGDQIFGHTGVTYGGDAEYICLHEEEALAIKPAEMTYVEAATVAYSAMTALPFLKDHANVQKGQKVLINGASGSIGTFAVQIAKYFGAEVTGVCGTINLEMVKLLGVDNVIDYTKEDFTNSMNVYDVIFDTVGKSSFSRSKKALKQNGIYLSTVPSFDTMIKMLWTSKVGSKKAKFVATGLRKNPKKIEDLNYLKDLYEAGNIKPVIDRCYPLEQIAEAHRYVEKGHKKGDVVITLEHNNKT